jgi:hypothetical protein
MASNDKYLTLGHVGIGTTSPAYAIHVASAGTAMIGLQSTDASGRLWDIQSDGTGSLLGKFEIVDRTASASRMTIDTAGNVGIGTTAPTAPLTVARSGTYDPVFNAAGPNATDNLSVMVSNAAGTASLSMFVVGSAGSFLTSSAVGDVGLRHTGTGNMLFGTGPATTAMAITASGNVGIGTTAPSVPLEVNGMVASKLNGYKFPDGSIQISAAAVSGLVSLTDAANIAVNGALGAVFKVTLAGNRILSNATNLVAGATYTFMFTQDGTGGRTLTFDSNYKFPSSISAPVLTSAPGVTDAAQFVSDGTYLYYMSGFASATAPCFAPTNVTVAVGIGAASVTTTLTWYDTNTTEVSYSIDRSADGVTGWTPLTSVAANSTTASYTDADLSTQSYYWRATANCGVSGSNSSVALTGTSSVTTPTGVIQSRSGNTTTLSWNDTPSEDSYQIERAVNGGAWGNINNPVQNSTSYSDTGLDANTVYTYRIRAVQGASYSAYGLASMACPTPATFTCGYSGNDCYSNVNAVFGASAVTPNGRCLTMVYANGTSGFLVWKDQSSSKILSPNGLDSWSMALNLSGRGKSTTAFSDPNLGTGSTVLAGRVCPTNVYIDDTNKVSTGNCLYYTPSYAVQATNAGGDDGGAQLGFSTFSGAAWYRGNMAICSSKKMRPPTLYETSTSNPGGGNLPLDASPTFDATNGVPGTGWTSTCVYNACTGGNSSYWGWSGTSASYGCGSNGGNGFSYPGRNVTCVLP